MGFASPCTSESNPPVVRTSQLNQPSLDVVVSIERLPVAGEAVPIGTGFVVASTRYPVCYSARYHIVLK
jgi:hypothetical protein